MPDTPDRTESGLTERSETRLLCRAVQQGWPVSDETKAKLLAKIAAHADNPKQTERDVNRAILTLAALDRLRILAQREAEAKDNKTIVVNNHVVVENWLKRLADAGPPELVEPFLSCYSAIVRRASVDHPRLLVENDLSAVSAVATPSEATDLMTLYLRLKQSIDPQRVSNDANTISPAADAYAG